MKTATITFHASHNYGSMLQAFALQRILKQLGIDNEILNLRTQRQKDLYAIKKHVDGNVLKRIVYEMLVISCMKELTEKSNLFERFLTDDLILSREFSSENELRQANLDYDCYISGGDQIWNTSPLDFDWSFYLPFVKKGKRISYAVSMGPDSAQQVTELDQIKQLLKRYQHISVREEGTKRIVESLVDIPVEISLDPVLLMDASDWNGYYLQKPIIQGEYILVYTPFFNETTFKAAEIVGKRLHSKIINTVFSSPRVLFYPLIQQHYATGPWEFLNLLQHSKMVVSGSFHAVLFSMLYHKPFVVLNGMKDNRMRTMLENTGLVSRSVSMDEIKATSASDLLACDFRQADDYIIRERQKSIDYLKHSILD